MNMYDRKCIFCWGNWGKDPIKSIIGHHWIHRSKFKINTMFQINLFWHHVIDGPSDYNLTTMYTKLINPVYHLPFP